MRMSVFLWLHDYVDAILRPTKHYPGGKLTDYSCFSRRYVVLPQPSNAFIYSSGHSIFAERR